MDNIICMNFKYWKVRKKKSCGRYIEFPVHGATPSVDEVGPYGYYVARCGKGWAK